MNKQELFTTIYNRMVAQGVPAYNTKDNLCQYETSQNMHCAIGCVLPEGHEALTSICGVKGVVLDFPELSNILGNDFPFLNRLQAAHDLPAKTHYAGEQWVSMFKNHMQSIANEYQLQVPK